MRIINYLKFLILIYIFLINIAYSDTIQIESEKLEILKTDGISIFTGNTQIGMHQDTINLHL